MNMIRDPWGGKVSSTSPASRRIKAEIKQRTHKRERRHSRQLVETLIVEGIQDHHEKCREFIDLMDHVFQGLEPLFYDDDEYDLFWPKGPMD